MERFSEKYEQCFRINFENNLNFQNFNLNKISFITNYCSQQSNPKRYKSKTIKEGFLLNK